jgi:hypothetical protein
LPVPGSLAAPLKLIGVPSGAVVTLEVPIASGGIASGDSTRTAQAARRTSPPALSLLAPSAAERQVQLPVAVWLLIR